MATFTLQQLLNPPTYDQVKSTTYDRLIAAGFTSIRSYAPESLPVCLVETESQAQDDVNQSAAYVVQSGYNDLATDAALTYLSSQVYQNERGAGVPTTGQFTLTLPPGTLGPYTFSPLSVSFSAGPGGRVYNGVAPDGVDPIRLNSGGSVKVYAQAEAVGSAYNVNAGTVNTFSRGRLAGVTVTNAPDWLAAPFSAPGVDPTTDANLRQLNRTNWGTLSQFKANTMVQSGYENMARKADPTVTRVSVLTNLDISDPGRVDVLIAGTSGALGAGVVATVQTAIAPLQTGGANIPETAKCVVTSASNLTVTVAGTVIVDPAYNNAGFLVQINADLTTFFSSFLIGGGKLGKVSYDRVVGLVMRQAGTANAIILDGTSITVNGGTVDLPIAYYQVPMLVSTLALQSL